VDVAGGVIDRSRQCKASSGHVGQRGQTPRGNWDGEIANEGEGMETGAAVIIHGGQHRSAFCVTDCLEGLLFLLRMCSQVFYSVYAYRISGGWVKGERHGIRRSWQGGMMLCPWHGWVCAVGGGCLDVMCLRCGGRCLWVGRCMMGCRG
jgi:hypothetical protein